MSAYDSLLARLNEVSHVGKAAAILDWDHQCYMPEGAAEARAGMLATLGKLTHEMFVSGETQKLLEQAEAEGHAPGSDGALTLRAVRRDFDKSVKLPTQLVSDLARETALGHGVWAKARAEKDFSQFAPALERILELTRQAGEHYGYDKKNGEIYDALLDNYEAGARTSEVVTVFEGIRPGLIELLNKIKAAPQVNFSCLERDFDETAQLKFAESVAARLGFDFKYGRQDKAVHPFCTSFTRHDVRITTRTEKNWLPGALMGTIHETGHGLYEQGFDPKDDDTPLSDAVSLGVHESQSRLWENIVGRSRPFWHVLYPDLQAAFPGTLTDTSEEGFWRAINRVEPSFIRVEADEVTYGLHIMLRFEIEREMLSGTLAVKDIPDAWNAKMESYLGITPPDDALGCLQDVHWSAGLIGYFPTYLIGTALSSQLYEQALKDNPAIAQDLVKGEYGSLLSWLREKVHHPGRRYLPGELIERICGGPARSEPYLNYLNAKFTEVYGL
jgi:carboxypeptidase Taq